MSHQIQNSNESGKTLFQWLIPNRRLIKWFLLIFLSVLCLVFIGFQLWAHYHYQDILDNDILYPALKEQLEMTIDFPPEYREELPISSELRQALSHITEAQKSIPRYNTIQSNLPNTFALQDKEDLFSQLQPLTQASRLLSKQIERDIQSCTPGEMLPLFDPLMDITYIAKSHLSELSQFLLTKNQYDAAFKNFIDSICLFVRCPYQDFDMYCHENWQLSSAIDDWSARIPFLSSQEFLYYGLEILNRSEPFLFQDLSDRFSLLPPVFLYKKCQRHFGGNVPVGQKGIYYISRLAKKGIPEMDYSFAKGKLEYHYFFDKAYTEREIAGLLRPFVFSSAIDRYFYLCNYSYYYFPNNSSLSTYKQNWKERILDFDRFRLSLAARLYQLETGKPVNATTDLVPAYFPEEIKDRTTGAPYQWDANGNLKLIQ